MPVKNSRFGIPTPTSDSGFSCSMTGYSKVVQQIVQLLMVLVTLGLNAVMSMIPENFRKAVMYVYNFITSAGNWIGYLFAAVYYVLNEYQYGAFFCQYSGYSIYLINWLSQLINFVNKWDQNWRSPGLSPETYINLKSCKL